MKGKIISAFGFLLFLPVFLFAQPLSNPRALSKKDMPLVFLQAYYVVDDAGSWGSNGPLGRVFTKDEKKAYVRMWSKLYNSIEYVAVSYQDSFQLNQLREFQTAIKEVSQETGKNFFGILDITRPPGFYEPADIAQQPLSYRAVSLKSNGALWYRKVEGSIFDFLGSYVDIANPTARQAMLARMATAYSANGNPAVSMGPIYGFTMLSEAKLTPIQSPDTTDLTPLDAGGNFPLLRGGNVYTLFFDNNLENSFFIPPKRAVPLYSLNAKNSFVTFAQAHGVNVSTLPADRNEFNDDDATVNLPAWVSFVPITNTQVWSVWEQWIQTMWTDFCLDISRTIMQAQAGNPGFRGTLYFQLPLWYSINQASQSPVTYKYYDAAGNIQSATETMANYPEYKWLNTPLMGLDLERLMADSSMVGFIHESTCSVPANGYNWPDTVKLHRQHYAETTSRRIHYHFAQGELCKQVCDKYGKYFGWFIRDVWFDGVISNFQRLDTAELRRGMVRELPLMNPDIVSALLPGNVNDMDTAYHYLIPWQYIESQAFHDPWKEEKEKFDTGYVAPLWLNPYSLGFIDVATDSTAVGWSYDPWSDSTDIEVILTGGPACAFSYPKSLGTFSVNITSTPSRIAAISNFVIQNASYSPPASITKFDFSVNLKNFISQKALGCPTGTYSVTLRVTDKQGKRWHDMLDLSHSPNSTTIPIKVGTVTGLNDIAGIPSISIYPNPSSGQFTVVSPSAHSCVKITNVLGKKVYEGTLNTPSVQIDLSESGNGMYFLYFISESGTVVRTLMLDK